MASNKMLIDASHPEETRVVVVRGNRIEEFDFEAQERKQLRGNIYLAKVTRVEPSLQAAFVDYGGNRHGFLAFSEIHPDYYQIPAADRQALLAEEEAAAAEAEAAEEAAQSQVDLAVAISCVGRRLVLGARTDEELDSVVDALGDSTAVVGFYSYGEISPAHGLCTLQNQTMTLTTISESAAS